VNDQIQKQLDAEAAPDSRGYVTEHEEEAEVTLLTSGSGVALPRLTPADTAGVIESQAAVTDLLDLARLHRR
jgi:hypothetical protein